MKKQYWKSISTQEKINLANELGVNAEFLRQVFMSDRRVSASLARAIFAATGIGAHEFCSAFLPGDVLSLNLKKA